MKTKKEIRLKNLKDAAGKSIHSIGKYKPYEKFHDRNNIIMKRLLDELIAGKIDYVIYKDTENVWFKCIHRSTRGHKAQFSIGYYRDGELIPLSHTNIDDFDDLSREGFPTGIWEYGKVA